MFQREYIMGLTPVGGKALRCRKSSTTKTMEFMLTNMYTKVGRAKRSVVLLKRPGRIFYASPEPPASWTPASDAFLLHAG